MRRSFPAAALLALAACGADGDGGSAPLNRGEVAPTRVADAAAPAAEQPVTKDAEGRWDLQSSGEGAALALLDGPGATAIRLFCPAKGGTLLVNVPAFRPVGSEERLSFGSGGDVVALVAGSLGDKERGGVSGTGAMPAELAALVRGPVSASYGSQTSGPHPAPSADLARAFVSACRPAAVAAATPAHPCTTQDGKRLDVVPLRAVGTEPFWGARIEGRCVTYSHPEDQAGTRVWTRYVAAASGGGRWTGALGGKPFALTVRKAPGCSDGMSDRRFPLAAELVVAGEKRSGCAERD